MRRLRVDEGGRALVAAAVVIVVVAGLAALVPAVAGPVLMAAHAEQDGAEPGMIVVADRENNRLQVFNPDGTFAFKIAGYGLANSIDVGPDGMIVVAFGGGFYVLHPNGTVAYGASSSGYGIGQVADAARAAVAPDGRIVVVDGWIDHSHDRVLKRVQVFSPDGAFESVFEPRVGHPGNYLYDVDVGPDGLIFLLDSWGVGRGSGVNGSWWTSPGHVRAFHPNGTLAFSLLADDGDQDVRPSPVKVAVGPDGEIVTIEGDTVRVYRPNATLPNGTAVGALAHGFGGGPSYSGGVLDIAVGPDGSVVVSRSDNTVQVYHHNGSLALTFGGYGSVQGGFDRPTDAAVGPDGRIVVAEPGKRAISVFHPNGTLDFAFGSYGSGDDAFYEPHQVAVGPDGRIVVGDTRKHRILVFEPDGSPALAFGSQGYDAGQISDVRDVAVAPNGSVVVVDHTPRVQVFSPDGEFVSVLDPRGDPWSCWSPLRAAVGPDGKIVVVDECEVVRAFHPNGTVAFYIELEPGGATDSGIAVGPDGRIVVVQDSRNQVFNPDGTFVFATEIDVDAVVTPKSFCNAQCILE